MYHVTNRGVDRCDLFHSDLDRIVFLSLVADACVQMGVVVHAFCLMTNHFHLVIEDSRGLLSLFMHRVESVYARFFNDTRPGRRVGPLYQGRFHADEITDRAYFDAACAYVVNNPLRTLPAMVARPDDYRWSSAAFVLGGEARTGARFCAALLDRVGGVDGVRAAFGPTPRKASEAMRARRLDALASGAWIERHHVLDGRSADDYRAFLDRRVTAGSPFARADASNSPFDRADAAGSADVAATASAAARPNASERAARVLALPSRPSPFAGLKLEAARGHVEAICDRFPPATRTKTLAYLLTRFCSVSAVAIARVVRLPASTIADTLASLRVARTAHQDTAASLRRAEWALQWRLLAAPFRL